MSEGKRKVLLFEDNPKIRELLEIFFRRMGIEVRIENDGAAAVAAAQEFRPHLVVMDYIMPGMDGVEAVTELRRSGVLVPIVMLTSNAGPAAKKRAFDAGATAFLTKPFNPKDLEAVISQHLLP